jgi:MICOS complex subunit MIC19
VPPARQTTLDSQVRARIQAEITHLQEEEQVVRAEIERALEKENLDKERSMAGAESLTAEGAEGEAGNVKSSTALLGDLEEIRQKVDRFKSRQDLSEFPEVKAKGEAVVTCYQFVTFQLFNCTWLTT